MAPCRPCRLAVRWFPQVNGYGSSSQTSFGETGGVAQASGSFSHNGIETVTSARQYATSDTYGHVSGNAPIMVGDSIANGGATFEKTDTNASATGSFHAATFGATASIRDRRDWPLPRVQPLSQRSGRLRPSGQGHHEDHCSCPILSLAAFSATAQTNNASSSTTSATSGATNAGNTQGITFNSKSDASGTLRTAPAMGGQASTARSLRTAAWCRRAGRSVVGFGMNVAFPIEDQKCSLRRLRTHHAGGGVHQDPDRSRRLETAAIDILCQTDDRTKAALVAQGLCNPALTTADHRFDNSAVAQTSTPASAPPASPAALAHAADACRPGFPGAIGAERRHEFAALA